MTLVVTLVMTPVVNLVVNRAATAFVLLIFASAALATADGMEKPLTSSPGEALRGEQVFRARAEGHCLLCHQVDSLEAPFQGNLGPDLSDVGSRLTPAQLRYRIVDASRLNPQTIMPAYYRPADYPYVASAYEGRTVLSAQQVEDLVAYLASLTGATPQ